MVQHDTEVSSAAPPGASPLSERRSPNRWEEQASWAHATRALIDLDALRHNVRRIQEYAPRSRMMAIIKADAYGHGSVRVARALPDVSAFGVARLSEAIALREAGIKQPIILLEGFLEAAELPLICQHRLTAVIHHTAQLAILECASSTSPIATWLKIDSGMHRLGFAPADAKSAWQRLRACAAVNPAIGLMTHLASADDRSADHTLAQLACFNQAVLGLPGERAIANSAGIMGWPQTHGDWVRPGLMLYGVSPFVGGSAHHDGLKPVMTLVSRLIATNQVKKGDGIGYGASWVCPEDMPVGIAAIGYGDGYPRHAEAGTPVLVNGQRVPLIGRVSMDMICLDLRSQPHAKVGDPVVLWGEGLPVEEVARHASTIPYELLCGVARRVKAITVESSTLEGALHGTR